MKQPEYPGYPLTFRFFPVEKQPTTAGTKLAIFDITEGENVITQLGFTEWDPKEKTFGLPELPVEGATVQLAFWAECDLMAMKQPQPPETNGKIIQMP